MIAKIGNLRNLNLVIFAAAGIVLFGWLANTPGELLGKTDAIGYAVCHRIDVRSFHLGQRPLSLCARCTGMYLGAVLALLFQTVTSPRRGGMPGRNIQAAMLALSGIFALDGLNSFSNLMSGVPSLYQTTNTLRILSGTGFGIVIGLFVYPAFNQTIWRRWDRRPAISGLAQFGLLLLLGLALVLAVLTENPAVLLPLTVVSAAGVLLLLTLVYWMLLQSFLRQENHLERPLQLTTPLTAGFAAAMLQIALLDLVRFAVTGTWEGFHIFLG